MRHPPPFLFMAVPWRHWLLCSDMGWETVQSNPHGAWCVWR